MFDALSWTARGGPDVSRSRIDTSDPDAAVVLGLCDRIRETTVDAVSAIAGVGTDPELSPKGILAKQQRIAERAIAMVVELGAAEATRKALKQRLEAAPVPGLDTIPPTIFAPLLAALQKTDPAKLIPDAREWMQAGDIHAAVMLANLTGPLALVSKAQAAELKAELRMGAHGTAAAKAAALQDAVAKLDAAVRAAVGIIREAAGIKVEGSPHPV